jgi:hypothetical protein
MSGSDLSIRNDEIWCPLCQRHTKFMKIMTAAKIADVNRRTVYRYIEGGVVQVLKVAGKTTRVCSGCLFDRGRNKAQ